MEHPLQCDQSEHLVEFKNDTPVDEHRHMGSLVNAMSFKQETDPRDLGNCLDKPGITREFTEYPMGRKIKQEQSDCEYLSTTPCIKPENGQIPTIPVDSLPKQEEISAEPIKLEPNTSDDAPCKLVYKNEGIKQEDLHLHLCQSDNEGPIEAPFPVVLYQRRITSKLTEEKEKMECDKLDGPMNDQEIVSTVPNIHVVSSHEQFMNYHEFLYKPRHIDGKPYKCPQCDYSAAIKRNLSKHMKRHNGEKPHKCSQCDYSAAFRSNLSQHLRMHTGDRPYKCSQCDYSAKLKGNLSKHMRTHTGERPYKCSQCDYSAKLKSHLSKHMRMHTGERPYKCSQCDYSAVIKNHLSQHMRTHNGERPYKCSWCDYSAKLKSHLSQHMRTHNGEKP